MNRRTTTIYLVGMALFAAVVIFALYFKGNVKAGVVLGPGSFFVEATERHSR